MSGSQKDKILAACRADMIPEAQCGLWSVKKLRIGKPYTVEGPPGRHPALVTYQPGTYTQLFRSTQATMHKLGELVMTDADHELNTHMQFMLRASGRVLVSGLGLGCVVRGLLAKDDVEHVVCLERDPSVLKLVGIHMPEERCAIIMCDALDWCSKSTQQFDCAWHDIWSDEDAGEPHLQILHQRLIHAMLDRVKFQGAWAFPRYFRRSYRRQNVL